MAEVRPAQKWLFVETDTDTSGSITAVGVDADPCRIGNAVEFEGHRHLVVPHLGVIAVSQEKIIKEVEL